MQTTQRKLAPSFAHPLLKFALRQGDSRRAYRRFAQQLRVVLDDAVPIEERRELALRVLNELEALGFEDESTSSFEVEWLHFLSPVLGGAKLWLRYAHARLSSSDLQIVPEDWHKAKSWRSCPQIPRLEYMQAGNRLGGVAGRPLLPPEVAAAWDAAIGHAIEAVDSGELARWSAQECACCAQALILSALYGDCCIGKLPSDTDRLHFLQGVGTGLWCELDAQLKRRLPGERLPTGMLAAAHLQLRGMAHHPIPAAKEAVPSPGQSVYVVAEPIPPSRDKSDAALLAEFELLAREPQPVARMPSPAALKAMLAVLEAEFPWANEAVENVAQQLLTRSRLGVLAFGLRPILLVGPPGSGKSRLVRRLAELLGLPYMPFSCAGVHDAKSLAGTSRGWATGEPSPILRLMLTRRSASALILLDEIDKAARNGEPTAALTSLLLGLLEPETSRRWRDSFLQAPCDLSNIVFVATANGLSGIPKPVLSRFSIALVPQPRAQDLDRLVSSMTSEIAMEMGVDPGILPVMPAAQLGHSRTSARELRAAIAAYLYSWTEEHLAPERLH